MLIELKGISTENFLPRVEIKNYNVLIGGRSFYDQPIDDELRKYDEVRNTMIGRGEDYETLDHC